MSKFQELSSLIWSVADDVFRGLFKPMKKSLGSKCKVINPGQQQILLDTCTRFGESEISKIYPNTFFGYTKVILEQPLTEYGQVKTDKNGNPKPDSSLRDYERIPLGTNIDEYYQREVKPHLPAE
ncbi:MAG: hypothetical protein EOM90_15240 [Alphaproteobacteria bacterium]|nr:hypothetical protein [Alphaproteobacteria bacterium]